ncbi:MAG: hypothetical protein C0448_05135 [Sphingobacteriaceae bacterium]|nr:hypothetical protein [Sphingobacteriaceae bacterium]
MTSSNKIGYDFSKPTLNDELPPILHEISGLAIIDSTSIACVQDEDGILFIYNIKKHKITQQHTFGLKGDYEGITLVDDILYVLRSDGVLFEIKGHQTKKLKVKTYSTKVPAINNEGLCYDAINNRLLIGAKGKINKDPTNKDVRLIYAFDLKTKTLNQSPAFNFNITDINLTAKMQGIHFPKKQNKKGKSIEHGFKFNTSEISIHPITHQLFVLSATEHVLFVFNKNGALEYIEQLNPLVFNKSEGLDFFQNGDLIISNEGQTHMPTLLRFNYMPK